MKSTAILITAFIGFMAIWTVFLWRYKQRDTVKPIESYLVQVVNDPNWITNYGVDLESRLVYNVALLNQVVDRQGMALKRLLKDPNKIDRK